MSEPQSQAGLEVSWGPKMLALNDRQRAFVAALYCEEAPPKGDGRLIFAARQAGYGTGKSTNKVLGVIANRLVHDEKIQKALAEYSRRCVRAISPEAVTAVRELIRDPKSRDHARAIAMVLDRIDPLETTHNVKIEPLDQSARIEATQKVLERIEELARRAGIPALPPPIEGEFTVVPGETT